MEELFHGLGFSASEAKVYLSLAEMGKGSATTVAKKLNLPRSTVYSLLQALIQRGVVSVEQHKDISFYVPNPPASFNLMLKAETDEFLRGQRRKEAVASELEKNITPYFRSEHYSVPKIQFFEGRKNVNAMLYAFQDIWREQIARLDFTWWGHQDVDFVQDYRKWLDQYWAALHADEKIHLLSNKSEVEEKLRGKVKRRHIKQLPKGIEFSSTVWVLGEYVVLIMTRQQPHYAFQMRDAVFADNQRRIFQLLWRLIT